MSQNLTFARPYARAAFELAFAEKSLPQWSQMLAFAALVSQDPLVQNAMKNPRFDRQDLENLFQDLGKDLFTKEMKNFIHALAEFKRWVFLPEIAQLYEELRAKAERMVTVELVSALPVEDSFQQRFIEALKKRMQCDITLACVTDQSILGGAIIRAKDLVIDGSIRGRLAKLGDAVGIS